MICDHCHLIIAPKEKVVSAERRDSHLRVFLHKRCMDKIVRALKAKRVDLGQINGSADIGDLVEE